MVIEPQSQAVGSSEDAPTDPLGGSAPTGSGNRLARLWWIVFIRGLIALALGLSVVLSGATRPGLANFIGMYWLVGAALTFRWVLANRWRPGSRIGIASAIVGTVAAVSTLARSSLSDWMSPEVFVKILGVNVLLVGLLRVGGTIRDDQVGGERPRLRHRLLVGALDTGLGIVLLAAPAESRAVALGHRHVGPCRGGRACPRCSRPAPPRRLSTPSRG